MINIINIILSVFIADSVSGEGGINDRQPHSKPVLVTRPSNESLFSIIFDYQAVPKWIDDKQADRKHNIGREGVFYERQDEMWHQCPTILPSYDPIGGGGAENNDNPVKTLRK